LIRLISLALASALAATTVASAQAPHQHGGAPPAVTGEAAPKVISTFPPTDAVVPAGIQQISVTFDRPMAESWSFVTGGEKSFPEIDGGPTMSDDKRTISVAVKLHPNSAYVVWLNSDRFQNFKDEQGHPATPYRLAFTTSE
jgi:hypothetical protein